jgi:DNA (cytosine-5)-methyltransferase 1
MKKIKVGSDFSGVGAFNQALMRLGIDYEEVFACDMDKYARETFIHNYGQPEYYPLNVYEREIPSESLDIYMTSPPCQAFSLAGKRLGKDDKRGVLFFNSHEFIQVNKPRYFIFENVKGLLSDDNGNTFNEWVNLLGGKSVNGNAVLFPHEDSVPYHLYWKVVNAKNHGVPQNRERVFLIGIRDDKDNSFRFPVEEHLTKRLKDVLEDSVDDKYFLSELSINYLLRHNGNKDILKKDIPNHSSCIPAGYYKQPRDCQYLKIKSATSKGYEEATEGDSINFSVPNSETRRGRVGKQVAQTLDTQCNQGVWIADYRADEGLRIRKDGISPCMTSSMRDSPEWNPKAGTRNPPLIGYNCKKLNETLEKNILKEAEMKILDTYNRNVVDNVPTLTASHHDLIKLWDGYKIRRLTPRECFRLMDFPESFNWFVSDSQAYKQAGNSIVVKVLEKIIKNLKL